MEYIDQATVFVKTYWLSCLFGLFSLGMMGLGWKQGGIRRISSLLGCLFSVLLAKILYPSIHQTLGGNQAIYDFVSKNFEQYLSKAVGGEGSSHANIGTIYEMFHLDTLTGIAVEKAVDIFISVVLFVLILVIVNIALFFVFEVMDGVMNLPVINWANRAAGAAIGFAQSVIYLWVFVTVVCVLPGNALITAVLQQLSIPGSFAKWIVDTNLITVFVHALVG